MISEQQQAVGVVGLGIIGSRVAGNLRAAGLCVHAWNRSPREEFESVASPAEVAKRAAIIQVFVSDGKAVLEVLAAMLPELGARHHVLVHATVHPDEMRQAAALVEKAGACLLDAPFTGSRDAAAAGELCYYLAGDIAAVERVRPLLEITGSCVIFPGRVGDASILKIASNMITATTVQALAEALALVGSSGLDARWLGVALENNACRSALTDMKLPAMLAGDYAPRFSVKNMIKDSAIASALAADAGLDFPVLRGAAGALCAAGQRGCGDEDFAAVAKAYTPLDPGNNVDQQ